MYGPMKRVQAQKVYYEIGEALGSGLTSEVYSAFRKDTQGWTKQHVALKIIRSKKNVQVLKQEFETLSQIRSLYCVRVLAWEVLNNQPALVLEFIEGVTLKAMVESGRLQPSLVVEILCQVQRGLSALHGGQAFHGDLNPSNIMINSRGIVKLIDFGFGSATTGQFLTPEFASPSRLQGEAPSESSDWYAFQKLGDYLFTKMGHNEAFDPSILGRSKTHQRRKLAELVQNLKTQVGEKTVQIESLPKKSFKMLLVPRLLIVLLAFLFTLFNGVLSSKVPQYHPVEFRSQNWFSLNINSGENHTGPFFKKKLRQGQYRIGWKSPSEERITTIYVDKPKTFLLQPGLKTL